MKDSVGLQIFLGFLWLCTAVVLYICNENFYISLIPLAASLTFFIRAICLHRKSR